MGQKWKAVSRKEFLNISMCCKIRTIRFMQYSPVGREMKLLNEFTKIKLLCSCKIVILEQSVL